MSYDVVVIGAGITGAATAYYLKKGGADRVLLMDRKEPAAGGTGKSAAIIRQHYSNALAANLTREAISIFSAMETDLGRSGGFVRSGYTLLLPADMADSARENVALLTSLGIDTTIDGKETLSQYGWLNPEGVVAVVREPDGGYADPVRSTEAFVEAYRALGGETRFNAKATALTGDSARVTGVLADGEEIRSDLVVNAAGPWSGELGKSVGLDMPLKVFREQDTVWEVPGDRPIPNGPVSNAVDAFYMRPLGNRRFVVGRGFPKTYSEVDPDNFDAEADSEFVSDVLERMTCRLPPFQGVKLIDSYASLYDVTPDWYPFAGPRAGTEGYADAWGGSGHGFKLAPAIGRRLADWLLTGQTEKEFARLSHDRIAAGQMFSQRYGGNRG